LVVTWFLDGFGSLKLKLRGPFRAALFQPATPVHLQRFDPGSKQATSDKLVVQQPDTPPEKRTKNRYLRNWL
jgi:hypothetical protein